MSLTTEVIDAVVAELDSGGFSQSFDARRRYLPLFELQAMNVLHVTVVPKGLAVAKGTRNASAFDVSVDIAVQQRVNTKDEATIEPLVTLVEEIGDRYRLKRLDAFPNAVWVSTEHDPIYAVEHLERMNQFTSVLTLTYRVFK